MLKYLRLVKLFLQFQPSASTTIEWAEGDSKNLSAFMGTKTGAKLEAMSNAHIAQAAMNACSSNSDREYKCGIAQGVRVTWATIASLKFRKPEAHSGTQEDDSRILAEFT